MTDSKCIAFLDVAGNMGIADGDYDKRPTLSSFNLSRPGATLETRFGIATSWAIERVKTGDDLLAVYIEDPQSMPGRGAKIERLLVGWYAAIAGVFAHCHIPVHTVNSSTVRAFFIGFGGAKKDIAKSECMRISQALGLDPQTLDEADASAGWHWARSLYTNAEPPREYWVDLERPVRRKRAKLDAYLDSLAEQRG